MSTSLASASSTTCLEIVMSCTTLTEIARLFDINDISSDLIGHSLCCDQYAVRLLHSGLTFDLLIPETRVTLSEMHIDDNISFVFASCIQRFCHCLLLHCPFVITLALLLDDHRLFTGTLRSCVSHGQRSLDYVALTSDEEIVFLQEDRVIVHIFLGTLAGVVLSVIVTSDVSVTHCRLGIQ